jgi:drug/metabolite transporter (DMT)-like permease
MRSVTALAILFALLSAFLFATGWVAQQRVASSITVDGTKDPRFLKSLMKRPLWWAGTLGDTAGYVMQAIALAFGSLLLVQPLIVTSLLFALPLGAWWAGQKLPVRVWVWATVLAVSLAVFVIFGSPTEGLDRAPLRDWRVLGIVTLAVVIACVVVATRIRGNLRALLLGVAVGLLFGATAALTKSVVSLLDEGLSAVLTSWETYALAVAITAGTYLQQVAFQAATLSSSLPAATVLEPVMAAVIGVAVLEERLQIDGFHEVTITLSVIAMTTATIVLSRASGKRRAASELGAEPAVQASPPRTPA